MVRVTARQLFGDRVIGLEFRRQQIVMARAGAGGVRNYWKSHYGPLSRSHVNSSDRPDRVAGLDATILSLINDWRHDGARLPAITPSTSGSQP